LAVEELFNVKVTAVATQNHSGKMRRSRFGLGVTKSWKKAIVKLGPEHKIELF
jgi:large subunit ribosomal protein L23